MVGIRDAEDGYRQIGEFASQGIGPHELVLMPDGGTLAVANGGIRTHPDNDRAMLNLDTMQPSLAYLDLASGRLRDAFGLAARLHRLSIRHLAVNRDGHGRDGDAVRGQQARPGAAGRGCMTAARIRLLEAPPAIERRMRHYAGSDRLRSERPAARGVLPARQSDHVLGCRNGRLVDQVELADGCGVAPAEAPGAFVITGGRGDVVTHRSRAGRPDANGCRRTARPGTIIWRSPCPGMTSNCLPALGRHEITKN